jgi:hypothetical protein
MAAGHGTPVRAVLQNFLLAKPPGISDGMPHVWRN